MTMRFYLSAALFLLFLRLSTPTEELTSASLKQLVKSGKNGMVKFCQDWCTKCTRTQEDWDKLATLAKDKIFIGYVNCGKEKEFCKERGADKGCYTIQYWKNGVEHKYNGSQGYHAMTKFVNTMLSQKCQIALMDSTCSVKAQGYVQKWSSKIITDMKKEHARLKRLDSPDLAPELSDWIQERTSILDQIIYNLKSEV
mmetsp:Transcript_29052/g.40836  ORF Transcript_29052/g.40836 Transcript_29052/m.40836 type:complete len:198 (-) Transcript_29052:2020-2613(-)